MSHTLLSLDIINAERQDAPYRYRGTTRFVLADEPGTKPIGESGLRIDKVTLPFGAGTDELRTLSIFRGAECSTGIADCSVVYMADGAGLNVLLVNALRYRAELSKFVLVGIHNASKGGSRKRIAELLQGQAPADYDAFKNFAMRTVRSYVEQGQVPKRRYVAGMSNGGAWALDMVTGQEVPFDGAIVMSPAQWTAPELGRVRGTHLYIGAGLLEGGTLRHARKISASFKREGASVTEVYPPSGHSMNSWVNIWTAAIADIAGRF
ncbi:hypothetical protein [Pseudoduganella chitinolytica]|uniref:Alpha/beta hydrolase n=1 Tax=Pseudoduganella chitinolytica TaxID=34070 RepID=A0ABY8BIF4_9BURK|nr:hypothetical protein [Pseudoduganella chitinolytica]WEF35138.1 hypothetical protein PX653_10350 [Pseudoduganella chitinolytica]